MIGFASLLFDNLCNSVYCADEEFLNTGMTDEEMGGLQLHVECIFKYDHPNLLQIYLEAFAMFNHGIPRTNVEGLPRRGIDIFTSFQKFCNYLT